MQTSMGEVCSTGGGEANDPPMPKRPLPAPISDFYLEQSTSYLNCATLGPTPKSVLAAAVKEWEWLEQDVSLQSHPCHASLRSPCWSPLTVATAGAAAAESLLRER